ncbi:MAG: ribosome recycling factor [bacterium]|nr:ribosome recycling factor [bacterium]
MDLQSAEKLFQGSILYLEEEFSKMQVGRASTSMVEGVHVSAYDMVQPIKNLATITTPDPKTILIQPWDKAVLASIEKAIRDQSDLGLNPQNDGVVVRITIPQPTEERRKELVRVAYAKAEESKISVRSARQKAHSTIQTQLKDKEISEDEAKAMEKELQESVNKSNTKIDELAKTKEKDIMTV